MRIFPTWKCLPLLRIVRATGEDVGLPKEDPEYVPPCMLSVVRQCCGKWFGTLVSQVEASRRNWLCRLLEAVSASTRCAGIQFEQLMRLRTLNRYSARLPSLISGAGGHAI